MKRIFVTAAAAFLVLGGVAFADPPEEGYEGAIVYKNGTEPRRFACDKLELVRSIYDAGKENVLLMHPKYKKLAETPGKYNEPQCSVGLYFAVKVIEPPVLLGPVVNPIGDAELYFWAVHVDNTPKGGTADYWILYLDTKGKRPWLKAVGRAI